MKWKPDPTYAGLLVQAHAFNQIVESQAAQIAVLSRYSPHRITQLESQLESERDMNAQLTEELESWGA